MYAKSFGREIAKQDTLLVLNNEFSEVYAFNCGAINYITWKLASGEMIYN